MKKQRLIEIGPSEAYQWFEYAQNCIQQGIIYARRGFVDMDIEITGRGLSKGFQSSKVFIGASIFFQPLNAIFLQRKVRLISSY